MILDFILVGSLLVSVLLEKKNVKCFAFFFESKFPQRNLHLYMPKVDFTQSAK